MYFHWNDWMVNTTVAAIIWVHRNNRVFYYLFLSASMLFFKRKCNLQLFMTTGLYFFYQIWQINVSSFNGLHFTDLEFWWHLLEFVAWFFSNFDHACPYSADIVSVTQTRKIDPGRRDMETEWNKLTLRHWGRLVHKSKIETSIEHVICGSMLQRIFGISE